MCEREDTVVGCHVGRSTCVHVPFIRGGLRERRGVEGTREGRLVPLRGGAGEPTHRLLEAHGGGRLGSQLLDRLAQHSLQLSQGGLSLLGRRGADRASNSRACEGEAGRSWAKDTAAQGTRPHVDCTGPRVMWCRPRLGVTNAWLGAAASVVGGLVAAASSTGSATAAATTTAAILGVAIPAAVALSTCTKTGVVCRISGLAISAVGGAGEEDDRRAGRSRRGGDFLQAK